MQKLRTRLVNFRVSDEEFKQLKLACNKHGARCLSDFARSVMLAPPGLRVEAFSTTIVELDRRVAALESSLAQLADIIAQAIDIAALRPGN